MEKQNWPAWRYGPNGASAVFESEKDVPKGWTDHPSKMVNNTGAARTAMQPAGTTTTTTAKEAAKTTDAKTPAQDPTKAANAGVGAQGVDLDADGHPWSPELHAATKTKTQAGLWRMKVGVKRPDPVKHDL